MIVSNVLRLLATLVIANLAGRLVSKLQLPAILGWLITGMVLGPHAVALLSDEIVAAPWYDVIESLMECVVGLMIGTELVCKKMKRAGLQILVTTLTESLGTFLVVSLAFCLVFALAGVPVYLAFLLGGIALATAPAPSLSIVNNMKTSGPVTRTLIPMAALDDLVGALVFFLVLVFVSARASVQASPMLSVVLVVFLPIFGGGILGLISGLLMRRTPRGAPTLAVTLALLLASAGLGFWLNRILDSSMLNFMLIGIAYSAVFSNLVPREKLEDIKRTMDPVIGAGLILVILNLGVPLDYHMIFGAGLYTAVYIVTRAAGKYAGARLGATLTHCPATVQKYLGLTLLPHSGVSLVFTGMAVNVLSGQAPDCARILQGTIAAAAVINEVIAVYVAKKGFEWAGELHQAQQPRQTHQPTRS